HTTGSSKDDGQSVGALSGQEAGAHGASAKSYGEAAKGYKKTCQSDTGEDDSTCKEWRRKMAKYNECKSEYQSARQQSASDFGGWGDYYGANQFANQMAGNQSYDPFGNPITDSSGGTGAMAEGDPNGMAGGEAGGQANVAGSDAVDPVTGEPIDP